MEKRFLFFSLSKKERNFAWRSGAKFKKKNQIALWAKFYRTTINRKMQIKLFTIPLFDSGQIKSEFQQKMQSLLAFIQKSHSFSFRKGIISALENG